MMSRILNKDKLLDLNKCILNIYVDVHMSFIVLFVSI